MGCGHGLQFTNLGTNNLSYLVNSSFSGGYGCAIGVDKTSGMLIQNNVIYHTLGRFPFIINGNNTILSNNLVIAYGGGSSGHYLGDSIVAQSNFHVGSDFFYKGDVCLNMTSPLPASLKHSIKGNIVYGASVQVNGLDQMYPTFDSWPCIR